MQKSGLTEDRWQINASVPGHLQEHFCLNDDALYLKGIRFTGWALSAGVADLRFWARRGGRAGGGAWLG